MLHSTIQYTMLVTTSGASTSCRVATEGSYLQRHVQRSRKGKGARSTRKKWRTEETEEERARGGSWA